MADDLRQLFHSLKGFGPQDKLSVNFGADYNPKRVHVDPYRLAAALDREFEQNEGEHTGAAQGLIDRLLSSNEQVVFLEGPRGTGKSLALAVAEEKPYIERLKHKSAILIDGRIFVSFFEGADYRDEDDLSLRFAKGILHALMLCFERLSKLRFDTAETFVSKYVRPIFETDLLHSHSSYPEWQQHADQIMEIIRGSRFGQAIDFRGLPNTNDGSSPRCHKDLSEISDRYKVKAYIVDLLVEFLIIYKKADITDLIVLIDDYGELTSNVRFLILPKIIDYFRASCSVVGIRPFFKVAIYPDTAGFYTNPGYTGYLGSDLYYIRFRDQPVPLQKAEIYWSRFFHHLFALRARHFKLISPSEIQRACNVPQFSEERVLYNSCCRSLPLDRVFDFQSFSPEEFFSHFSRIVAYAPRIAGNYLSELYDRTGRRPTLTDLAKWSGAYWQNFTTDKLRAAVESMQPYRPRDPWQEQARNIYRRFLTDFFTENNLRKHTIAATYLPAPQSLDGFLQPLINYSYITPLTAYAEPSEIDQMWPRIFALSPGLPHVPLFKPAGDLLKGLDVMEKVESFFGYTKPYYLEMVKAGILEDVAGVADNAQKPHKFNDRTFRHMLQKPISWLRNMPENGPI